MDLLAAYSCLGISLANETPGSPDNDFFQQIKKSNTGHVTTSLTPGLQEVSIKITNPSRSEVTPITLGDQRELVVEIKKIIIDRCRSEQNDFLAHPIAPTPTIRSQQPFKIAEPLGVTVTKIV